LDLTLPSLPRIFRRVGTTRFDLVRIQSYENKTGEKLIERQLRVRWWDAGLRELSGLPFRDVERCRALLAERRAK
jgi:hypothetical protein